MTKKMLNNQFVVEQAHEIQSIRTELELLKCASPDKFGVDGFILQICIFLGRISPQLPKTRDMRY